MLKIENGLILSADINDREKLLQILNEVGDIVDGVKLGYIPLLSIKDCIEIVSEKTYVLADIKIADIPATNERVCKILRERGCDGITTHPFVGEDSIKACVNSGLDVFSVVDMTHGGAERFLTPLREKLASLSASSGVRGFIVPATRTETIRILREKYPDLIFLSPGVGAQGGSAYDVAKLGVNAVIVGRSIINSKNPRKVAEEIIEEFRRGKN